MVWPAAIRNKTKMSLKSGVVQYLIGILLIKNCICVNYREHPNWPKLDNVCGESSEDRISGGQETIIGQFPWMARILVRVFEQGRMKLYTNCGGSLVTTKHVISAEHCASDYEPYAVTLGEWDSGRDDDCIDAYTCADPIVTVKIRQTFHSNKFGRQKQHDILVFLLENPVNFTEWIKPICLPTGSEEFPNYGEVAGWGSTGIEKSSNILKYAKLPIREMGDCQSLMPMRLDENIQICAGGLSIDDACRGDSGGPFMQVPDNLAEPKYFLTGIVSMGPSQCGVGLGVYTKITAYMSSILDILE